MITAKEIMHKATPVLSFDSTVAQAIDYFRKHPTNFAAVQAGSDRFHGVLTEGGLMRIYLRQKTQKDKDALILYRDLFEPAQLIHQDEPFAEIVKKIGTAVGHRVFVINEKSQVVGYIKAKDILPLLTQVSSALSLDPTIKGHSPVVEDDSDVHSDLYLFENFFTQSPFMMHSVNRKGAIQMANEMLHRVLGYEYGELLGKTVLELYPQSAQSKVAESLRQIIDRGFHKVIEGKMVHKNGSEVEVEMVSRALVDPAGTAIGTVTVSRPKDMAYLLSCLPHT